MKSPVFSAGAKSKLFASSFVVFWKNHLYAKTKINKRINQFCPVKEKKSLTGLHKKKAYFPTTLPTHPHPQKKTSASDKK